MAHELEIVNGEASMVYAETEGKPWHRLGTPVSNDLTPLQMLKAAKLDWEVESVPLVANYDGKELATGHQALVRNRDSKVLDVITDDWHPTQNLEAFEFFNDFVAAGEMFMDTAGSLKDGKVVWALAKINESFEINGGKDKVDAYLHFTNPHQYGKSIDVRMTSIRCVCWNTVTASLNKKSKNFVKVSHRRKFDPDIVKSTLGIAHERLMQYKEIAQYLSNTRFKNEDIIEYFKRVFPVVGEDSKKAISKNAKLASENWMYEQPGAELGEGSFWQLLNATTYGVDHIMGRTNESRLHSAWYGGGNDIKNNAIKIAVEMAEAA